MDRKVRTFDDAGYGASALESTMVGDLNRSTVTSGGTGKV